MICYVLLTSMQMGFKNNLLHSAFDSMPKQQKKKNTGKPKHYIYFFYINTGQVQACRRNNFIFIHIWFLWRHKKGPVRFRSVKPEQLKRCDVKNICKEMVEFHFKLLDIFPHCCALYTYIAALRWNVAWRALVHQLKWCRYNKDMGMRVVPGHMKPAQMRGHVDTEM